MAKRKKKNPVLLFLGILLTFIWPFLLAIVLDLLSDAAQEQKMRAGVLVLYLSYSGLYLCSRFKRGEIASGRPASFGSDFDKRYNAKTRPRLFVISYTILAAMYLFFIWGILWLYFPSIVPRWPLSWVI